MSQDSQGKVVLKFQTDDLDGPIRLEFYDATEEERQQVVRALEALYWSIGGDGLEYVRESYEDVPDDAAVPGIPVDHFVRTVEHFLSSGSNGR